MRRYLPIVLFVFLFTSPLSAQPKEDVIYPRSSATSNTPAPADERSMSSNIILVTALLAAAAGWWLWQKRRHSAKLVAAGSARLDIVESRSLGSRQYLVVADYDGRKFLLGVCPGSIAMLTPLDKESPPSP